MKAKDFLEEIDYYNTNVEGQLYEELGIETLADMMELYHERKLKLLGIGVVSQQRELFAEQDSKDFVLWQRDREIIRLENGKYKWQELEYDRQFFLEKYLEYRNKANCG